MNKKKAAAFSPWRKSRTVERSPRFHSLTIIPKVGGHDPLGSMYGVYTYIYHKNQPNVGKYTIHGSYGPGLAVWLPSLGVFFATQNILESRIIDAKSISSCLNSIATKKYTGPTNTQICSFLEMGTQAISGNSWWNMVKYYFNLARFEGDNLPSLLHEASECLFRWGL